MRYNALIPALALAFGVSAAAAPAFAQDLVPPSVALTAPPHNSYLNSLPSVTGTAFDNVLVSSVQARIQRQSDGYYWDGSAFAAAQAWLEVTIPSTSPVSWTYSTVPAWLNGGAYAVNARAMDPSGNWSVPYSTAEFHYDTGLPASAVTVPAQGGVISSFTAINGTAWDNESFTTQLWVKVNRAADNYYWNEALSQWTAAEAWNLAVGSFTWTYTGLPAAELTAGATYTALSRAADLAGNLEISTGSAVSFVYAGGDDVVPPSAPGSFAAYQSGTPGLLRLSWTSPGDDGASGALAPGSAYAVQYSTLAPELVAWSTAGAQVTISTEGVAPGAAVSTFVAPGDGMTWYFAAWARDEAGNWSAVSSTASAFASPFSFETVDSAGDTGSYSSLAADAAGNLHAVGREDGNAGLRYFKRTGLAWSGPTVIDTTLARLSGVSLAVGADGLPRIAYGDSNTASLKYASFDGSSWTITTADADLGLPNGGMTPRVSMALDAAGRPHITYNYYDNNGASTLSAIKYAVFDGVAWSTSTVESNFGLTVTNQPSIALGADGRPHIAYAFSGLKYASFNGVAWSTASLDAGSNRGWDNSIVVGSDGLPRISYHNYTPGVTKFAEFDGVSWSTTTIEATYGYRTSLALDGAGNPHVAYYLPLSATKDLRYARRAAGVWTLQTVDSAGDVGDHPSLALTADGAVHISYYDNTAKDLRAAHLDAGLPAPASGGPRSASQAPYGLSGAPGGTSSITWTWTDNSSNELGFRLYGATSAAGPFELVAGTDTIAAGQTSYSEGGLVPGATYYRYVAAVNAGAFAVSPLASAAAPRPPVILPDGCSSALTVNNSGTGDYTSIQDAVDALPANLIGDACVVVEADGYYNEEVTVQGFTNNGYRIKIMAEPGGGPVTVSPQAGATAGFRLLNSSVTIENMEIIPAAVMPYGVLASSDSAVLSSVAVISAGSISSAGISVSSRSEVSFCGITVEAAVALWITGSNTSVSFSTLSNALVSPSGAALYLPGVSSNTVSHSYIANEGFDGCLPGNVGAGAHLTAGASHNTISLSTVTSAVGGFCGGAIQLTNGASHNIVTESYIAHTNSGYAVRLAKGLTFGFHGSNPGFNAITLSTVTSDAAWGDSTPDSATLYFEGASSNTVSQSYVANRGGGVAVLLATDNYGPDPFGPSMHNTFSGLDVRVSSVSKPAFAIYSGTYNIITQSYINNPQWDALHIFSDHNTVSRSTIATGGGGESAAIYISASFNTVSDSSVTAVNRTAVWIDTGTQQAGFNTITGNYMYGNGPGLPVLLIAGASSNTVSHNLINSGIGNGALIGGAGNYITHSTITAYNGLYFVEALSGLVEDSYLEGGTALDIQKSTGTVVRRSVMMTGPGDMTGLRLSAGSRDLFVSESELVGYGVFGSAAAIEYDNSGTISFSSSVFRGGRFGMEIYGQLPGTELVLSSVTFRDLLPGATAISFLPLGESNLFIATFTAVDFGDAALANNVDAFILSPGSRLTMRDASGPRYGSLYEHDPSGYVDWVPDYAPPALSSAPFSGLGTSSLTVHWGSTFDPGTNYFVGLATHAAAAPDIALATATETSYGFTGLTPDTTYYGFVSTDIASGYIASGSGPTLAEAPASAVFAAVAYSSAALTWSGGENPAWTVYEYQVHTSTAFSSFTSSGSLRAVSAWFGGLSQGTTYFARVRAVNSAGSSTAYAYTGPAVTGSILPSGLVSGPAGAALGVSSISWTWTSGTLSDTDRFNAYSGGVLLATSAFAGTGAHIQEGLTPNTSYTLGVTGANAFGESQAAISAAVHTLAALPAALSAASIYPSSAALAWALNGNPAGTMAQLWRSPDDAAYVNIFEGAALSHTDAGLEECTLYYYKARNINGDGLYTAFTAPLGFTTAASTPAAPGGLYAEALDGARIALGWEHSPSASLVTQYRLYYDNATGNLDYGTPYAVFSSTVSSWTTPALTPGSTYKFALRALSRCGVEEPNTAAAYAQAAGALSGVRAAIKTPQTGKKIKGNSVTVVAEIILGLPSQISRVRFQYRPQGGAVWTDITAANANHPNPDTAAPYFVHWDADAVGAGTYELRALAADVFDTDDPAPPVITVSMDPVDYDTHERVAGGELQKEQKINNSVTSTVQAADESTALLAKLVIPAGAVSVDTVAVTLVSNPASRPVPPSGSEELSLGVKINLSNGQSLLSAGKTAAVTLNYPDDNGDGIVDGTNAPVDRLRMFTAPDGGGAWTAVPTTLDRAKKTISGTTEHFSFFSVFAAPSASVGSVKAYPNPWQPGSGGRFDAAGVTLSGLPVAARIKIYTLLGELIRALDVTAADAGTKVWDGRNTEGSKAASGVYIIFVKSGSDKKTLKLAVER